MSPRRPAGPTTAKRVPYRAPRDRRELTTAIVVAVLIVVVTASLLWLLRPNRESSEPVITVPTTSATDTTPTESTAPAGTTTPEGATQDTTAADGG
jgi:hypothetical protein